MSNKHGTLAWGGRHISVIRSSFGAAQECTVPDWILDALFVDQTFVYAVTAHNVLLRIEVARDDTSPHTTSLTQPSHGLLMSAQICSSRDSNGTVTVVSGSQFGEIIVWSHNANGTSKTLYIIKAHEGPVFGVDLWDGLIASCSDDRTVKIWDVPRASAARSSDQSRTDALEHLEQPLAFGMRHESRVWKVRFLHEKSSLGARCLLSAGEDATCRLWRLDSTGDRDFTQIAVHKDHNGKNIWSMTTDQLGNGDLHVVTGGADGAIASRPILSQFGSRRAGTSQLNLQDCVENDGKDFIRAYDFLDYHCLVMTTETGKVYLRHEDQEPRLQLIDVFEDIQRYSIVKTLPRSQSKYKDRWCFFAGNSGKVFLYDRRHNQSLVIADVEAKVVGLFPQIVATDNGPASLYLLVTCLVPERSKLFCFSLDLERVKAPVLQRTVAVNTTSHIITSAFMFINTVIAGTRDGRLGILDVEHAEIAPPAMWWPSSTEAITAIHPILDSTICRRLVTTSRDGALRVYEVDATNESQSRLTLVHSLPLPFGPNVEGLYISSTGDRLWAYGFDKTDFVIYDVRADQRLFTRDCGGSHRHWACTMDDEPDGEGFAAAFACTRAGTVQSHVARAAEYKTVKRGGHGREIKACAVRPVEHGCPAAKGCVVATGAEDTDIRLWAGDRCVATLRKHVTGIQKLQWSADGSYLFSCGGLGEFFVWRVKELNMVALPIAVVFESRCPLDAELLDLRVMSFDVSRMSTAEAKPPVDLVTLGMSNSSIMHFQYTVDSGGEPQWTLLETNTYTSACITQVAHTCISDQLIMLTAATDGFLTQWSPLRSMREEMGSGVETLKTQRDKTEIFRVDRVHQSSVKTLHCRELVPGKQLIATGGDDNALTLSLLYRSTGKDRAAHMHRYRVPSAHAAAVTAATILEVASGDEDSLEVTVLTSSNDQRIKSWHVKLDLAKNTVYGVKKRTDVPTPIADVADMVLLPGGNQVLLCGVGMHTYSVDSRSHLATQPT